VVRASQQAEVPVTGVWLQDWMGKRHTALGDRLWWNWILDDHATLGSYAAWDAMREALGPVRLLVYANSFLADPEAAAPPGTETVTAARWRRSLFAEAVAEGYTVAASTASGVADTAGTGTAAAQQALESAAPTASKARGNGKAPHLLESAGFKAALLDVTHPQAREWMVESVLRGELLTHAQASGDG
jgi:alpha-glucosidase